MEKIERFCTECGQSLGFEKEYRQGKLITCHVTCPPPKLQKHPFDCPYCLAPLVLKGVQATLYCVCGSEVLATYQPSKKNVVAITRGPKQQAVG